MRSQAQMIEDLNYYSDYRNTHNEAPVTFTLDDGTEVNIPYKWEVCSVCDGDGTHVNPSIDAGGISSEDFYDDPDFAEEYFSGAYDQECNCCGGRRVERVADLDRLSSEHRKVYEAQQREERAWEAERRAERLMGC